MKTADGPSTKVAKPFYFLLRHPQASSSHTFYQRQGTLVQRTMLISQRTTETLHIHLHTICIPVKGRISLPDSEVDSWNHSLPRPTTVWLLGGAKERCDWERSSLGAVKTQSLGMTLQDSQNTFRQFSYSTPRTRVVERLVSIISS